jgi:hypothetical protein
MARPNSFLTLKDFDKVLIEYKRKKDKVIPYLQKTPLGVIPSYYIRKGDIYGMVVAIGPGIIGWSLCDKKDTFNKELGLDLALRRARIASNLSFRGRNSLYSKVPFTLNEIFLNMEVRSEKYCPLDEDSREDI